MKLRLDTSKTYAIALEGGGAKGAYEVGVWRALDEADVRFDAVGRHLCRRTERGDDGDGRAGAGAAALGKHSLFAGI